MSNITTEQEELLNKRKQSLGDFVAGAKPSIQNLAQFVGVENPQTAIDKPDQFLKILDLYLKDEDFETLDSESTQMLHTLLMYFVGELFLFLHGGKWYVDENSASDSFLHYVVGNPSESDPDKKFQVSPFIIVQQYLDTKPGRSLKFHVGASEKSLGLSLI